jgi:hypothetical protein
MACINEGIRGLPDLPEGLRIKRINEIYSHVLLQVCEIGNVNSLHWHVVQADPQPGPLIALHAEYGSRTVHVDSLG